MAPLIAMSAAFLALISPGLSSPIYGRAAPDTNIHWLTINETDGTWLKGKKDLLPQTLEFANMTVPMDWDNPQSNETMKMALMRLPCTNPSSRIGVFAFHPGGPGESAFSNIQYFSERLLQHFDIVAMDPRGIGRSNPIRHTHVTVSKDFPQTDSDYEALSQRNRNAALSAYTENGEVIKYMDGTTYARDLEALRLALGEEKMTFYGGSYGTRIAARYAELFPYSWRAIVMDANDDSTIAPLEESMRAHVAHQQGLEHFVSWCQTNSTCALQGQDVRKVLDRAIAKAGNDAGCLENYLTILLMDYSYKEMSETLLEILARLHHPPGGIHNGFHNISRPVLPSRISKFCTSYSSTIGMDMIASYCGDGLRTAPNVSEYISHQQELEKSTPWTAKIGMDSMFATVCLGWPFTPKNPPHELKFPSTIPPVLLVNSMYDVRTPYINAVSMQKQIPGSVLLNTRLDGHCAYNPANETDATRIIEDYLIDLKLPAVGTVVDA